MALTIAKGADVLTLLNGRDIAFGSVRAAAGLKRNGAAIVLDVAGGQDLAALATTVIG
jgi:hypothetical protein